LFVCYSTKNRKNLSPYFTDKCELKSLVHALVSFVSAISSHQDIQMAAAGLLEIQIVEGVGQFEVQAQSLGFC